MAMSVSSLLDNYESDQCGERTIVVKNLQDMLKEKLKLYLKVICPQELIDVYFPMKGCNIAIAVFKTDIEDIKMYQSNASRGGIGFPTLQLELLGKPAGIRIANLPDGISDDFLSLYFESKRSGGEEDTVGNVELVEAGGTKYAIIPITSQHARVSILSKQRHLLRNSFVSIEPFYPSVHEYMVDSLKNKTLHKAKSIPLAAESRTMCERTSPLRTVPHLDNRNTSNLEVKPTLTKNNGNYGNYGNYGKEPEMTGRASQRNLVLPDEKPIISKKPTYSPAGGKLSPRQHQTNTHPTHTSSGYPTSNAKSQFKLHIIYDDPLDMGELDAGHGGQSSAGTADVGDNVRNKSNRNGANGKPNPRNMQRQTSNDSGDGSKRTRRPRHKRPPMGGHKHAENQPASSDEVEISVSPVKIVALIMCRFQSKHQTDDMKVIFKERDGKVIIKGSTDEVCQQGRLNLLECLDRIVCKSEPLSCMKSRFLSREQCQRLLRSRCINQKVRATFEVDNSRRILHSYAFSAEDSERGLQFVAGEITMIKIQLREGEEQLLDGDSWKTLIEALDIGFTTVYLDEANHTLFIESFIELKAKEAESKVIQHFKQHIPKVSANVTLESAKAMCFQKCFAEKLRQDIE